MAILDIGGFELSLIAINGQRSAGVYFNDIEYPVPDGFFEAIDRQHAAWIYTGIAVSVPVPPPPWPPAEAVLGAIME